MKLTPFVKQDLEAILAAGGRASGSNICVASWSAARDDLSQWRAYSRRGTGYTINVKRERLRGFARARDFLFAECVYDIASQEPLMKSLIDSALAESLRRRTLGEASALIARLHRSKAGHVTGDFWDYINRYGALAYFPFALRDENGRFDVDSVDVGPCPEPDLASQNVESLLAKCCGECDPQPAVNKSRVLYRSW